MSSIRNQFPRESEEQQAGRYEASQLMLHQYLCLPWRFSDKDRPI